MEQIPVSDWQQLNTSSCPLLSHDFFKALETSQSVSKQQGWQPHHMLIEEDNSITGIMPLYIKGHSWGEYVFDWSWAEAFNDHNLAYYPKLVATIPFTPLPSDKLFSNNLNLAAVMPTLINHCQENDISSWHLLFVPEIECKNSALVELTEEVEQGPQNTKLLSAVISSVIPTDVYQRHTVQFHWFNQSYRCFDDFLAAFTSRKRKNTRKERLSIAQQGITIRRLQGKAVTEEDITFFYLTYQLTYMKNGHQPHLSFDFFKKIFSTMADKLLLIIASHDGEDVASALFFYDETHLYGRYWGSKTPFNNLHFELCYYQGIEFCIENNLQSFNPGTQGEHKIQRGFEPVLTHSYHWVNQVEFRPAIKDFCQREREHMQDYLQQCRQALPFKVMP